MRINSMPALSMTALRRLKLMVAWLATLDIREDQFTMLNWGSDVPYPHGDAIGWSLKSPALQAEGLVQAWPGRWVPSYKVGGYRYSSWNALQHFFELRDDIWHVSFEANEVHEGFPGNAGVQADRGLRFLFTHPYYPRNAGLQDVINRLCTVIAYSEGTSKVEWPSQKK